MQKQPKIKPYAILRGAMTTAGYDQETFARKIGRCETYVNARLGGWKPWDEDDIYKILAVFEISVEEMHRYFPRRGISAKQVIAEQGSGPRHLNIRR